MLAADDSYQAIQRANTLISSLTSCPSAARREIEAEMEEAAVLAKSTMRRLYTARTASQLVDNVSVAMTDTAARGVRTAISHARGEALDALFGKATSKNALDPARQSFKNDILHLPFTGTSLFGGRLTQATTAALETTTKREKFTKHLGKIGFKAKGVWTQRKGEANSAKARGNAKRPRRRRHGGRKKTWGPVPDKSSSKAETGAAASKAKPNKGSGKPGKGGRKQGKGKGT